MARTSEAQITCTPLFGTTPEDELNALVAVYRFLVLEKGDLHDLTNGATTEAEGANQDKKGNDSDVCC
jgi:hypothetical protein